jgi:N-methylhydantoinase A/oxoprolinase/acetone carboxylase beta subunit
MREVQGYAEILAGGVNFDGSAITALDERELCTTADAAVASGFTSVALTSVFAPLNRDIETTARDIMADRQPSLAFTLSADIGNLGILERENATILNAALLSTARSVVASIQRALVDASIPCLYFLSQNDGTLMSSQFAEQFPVRTFASGPTNSIRGAGFLAGVDEALVVDIGGTTTDVGALRRGYPRESANTTELAGLRTNFRMPDLMSLGIGGGSIIALDADPVVVGPQSVARELTTKSRVFGGRTLTTTDVAVAAGWIDAGDRSAVADLSEHAIARVTAVVRAAVERAVEVMRVSAEDLPIIVVGGGAPILGPDTFAGHPVIRPDFGDVANAVGSAIAHAGGESDRIYDLDEMTRDEAIELAKDEARSQCIRAGASGDGIEIVELDTLPLTYLPGSSIRIRAKAAGAPAS